MTVKLFRIVYSVVPTFHIPQLKTIGLLAFSYINHHLWLPWKSVWVCFISCSPTQWYHHKFNPYIFVCTCTNTVMIISHFLFFCMCCNVYCMHACMYMRMNSYHFFCIIMSILLLCALAHISMHAK